jgi:acyl-CoA thioesterase-2
MRDSPTPVLAELLALLDLAALERGVFQGKSGTAGAGRVFGGQVLAQALVAAGRTVPEGRLCHSLHAYFLRPGDPARPIRYQVDPSRDGGSFSARRVVALQDGKGEARQIFTLAASFHKSEAGFEHQAPMPDVPPPEALQDEQVGRLADTSLTPELRALIARARPFETRPVILRPLGDGPASAPVNHVWVRAKGDPGDDPALHRALLAFASDMSLLSTALMPHGRNLLSDIQIASIDHAMWFHRPFRVDDWLLFAQDSPSASGARGFSRGAIYARDGRLVASMAQEGLIRARKD